VDAYSVLGLSVGASDAEVAAAYRRMAKEWHPDVHGTEAALRRMVAINAAYEELRTRGAGGGARAAGAPAGAVDPRGFVGRELLGALAPGEAVRWFRATATSSSPQSYLVVTDARLLWLLDDAVSHRVRSLAFAQIASVRVEVGRLRRSRATLRVRTRHGRRFDFAELEPEVARAIAAHVLSGGSAR
jgi:hypothetical protein